MTRVLQALFFGFTIAMSFVIVRQDPVFSPVGSFGAEIVLSLALLSAALWNSRLEIDHPLFFFPLMFSLYTIATPVLNILLPDYQDSLGIKVWQYHYYFLASYVLAVVILNGLRWRVASPRPLTPRTGRSANAQLLFVFLLAVIVVFLAAAYATGVDRSTATGILEKGSSLFPIASSLLLVAIVDSRGGNRALLIWTGIFIAALLAVYVIMGNRSFLVKFVLALLIIVHVRYRPIDGKTILALVALAFVVAPLTKGLESLTSGQDYLTQVFYKEFKTSGRILYTYLDTGVANSYGVPDFLAEVINSVTFGALGYATNQQALIQSLITQSNDVGLGYSVVLSSVNLMGLSGIVVVPTVTAITAQWLYRRRGRSTGWLFSYAVFIMAISVSGRFELSFVVASILKHSAMILAILALVGQIATGQRTGKTSARKGPARSDGYMDA